MPTTHRTNPESDQIVDRFIEDHFAQSNETDDSGRPVFPLSAAEKLHLANRAGVDLDIVEQRLRARCEELPSVDKFAAVPRYCLKQTQ